MNIDNETEELGQSSRALTRRVQPRPIAWSHYTYCTDDGNAIIVVPSMLLIHDNN